MVSKQTFYLVGLTLVVPRVVVITFLFLFVFLLLLLFFSLCLFIVLTFFRVLLSLTGFGRLLYRAIQYAIEIKSIVVLHSNPKFTCMYC